VTFAFIIENIDRASEFFMSSCLQPSFLHTESVSYREYFFSLRVETLRFARGSLAVIRTMRCNPASVRSMRLSYSAHSFCAFLLAFLRQFLTT
jgi:hypothetical protein